MSHQQQHSPTGTNQEIGPIQTCPGSGFDPLMIVISCFVYEYTQEKEKLLLSIASGTEYQPSPPTNTTWSCCCKASSDPDKLKQAAGIFRRIVHVICEMYRPQEIQMEIRIESIIYHYVEVEVYRCKKKFWFELDRSVGGWCSDPEEDAYSDEDLKIWKKRMPFRRTMVKQAGKRKRRTIIIV